MKTVICSSRKFWVTYIGFVLLLLVPASGFGQGIIGVASSTPLNGATGVSTTQPLVLTFSAAVDTNQTVAECLNGSYPLTTTSSWSADAKTMTIMPVPSWPDNATITWYAGGQDANNTPVFGQGSFTTGTSGGGGGSGTNAITTFSAGTLYQYVQNSASAPAPDDTTPYTFAAIVVLASNRTATAISVALPTQVTNSLSANPVAPEDYFYFGQDTNLSDFTAAFPSGDYKFNVQSNSASQQVTVNLPSSLLQPNAPHLSNFAEAQTVDPTQPFTLHWDAFNGGGGPGFITVEVGDVFSTPDPGKPGALTSSATSVEIPAGTLEAGMDYDTTITFYDYLVNSNATYATIADRATLTRFNLSASSGGGGMVTPPQISGAAKAGNGSFSFTVQCTPNATNTVWYSTNLTSWQKLMTTNPPSGQFTVTDSLSDAHRFYRVSTAAGN